MTNFSFDQINGMLENNLKFDANGESPTPNQQPVPPQVTSQSIPVPNVTNNQITESDSLNFFDDTPPVQQEEPQEQPIDDDSDLPENPAAENFKKLRGVIKETRALKRQLEEELGTTKSKLEKYEKGEVVPDIIRAKDERIAQLEPYEKIINLKLSKEYQENFVTPALELRGKLEKIGEDYGISKDMLLQAVEITNRRDLNNFLSRHFDEVGGMEVKQVIEKLQDLGAKAVEAEKQPQEALQQLQLQYHEKQQEEIKQRHKIFELTSKDAWGNALKKTQEEGVYKELVMNPNDSEYNKKVVEPIQHRASIQYGALIKKLSENGLKTLPPELASGLARMVLLSIGGAMSLESKNKAELKLSNIVNSANRTAQYFRPSIGGSNGNGMVKHENNSPNNPAEAAKRIKFPGM